MILDRSATIAIAMDEDAKAECALIETVQWSNETFQCNGALLQWNSAMAQWEKVHWCKAMGQCTGATAQSTHNGRKCIDRNIAAGKRMCHADPQCGSLPRMTYEHPAPLCSLWGVQF